jgi:hypothetical protein
MNKKALIMLYFCAFGFVAASFLFYRYSDTYIPNEDLYLGEKQIQVFQIYQKADSDIYYIQHSALLCSKKVSKENFQFEFESCMNEYLLYIGYFYSDFSVSYSSSTESTIVTGISTKPLTYENEVLTYKINPYFKVEVPYALESSENLFV